MLGKAEVALKFPTIPSVKGISLDLALQKWSKTLTTTIIPTGGQVFSFKHLLVDSALGTVSVLVE